MIIRDGLGNPDPAGRQLFKYLANKYGFDKAAAEAAPARIAGIPRALTTRLGAPRKRGSRFFIGDALSALDIYWGSFAAMNNPLPDELCPMAPRFRSVCTNTDPTIKGATAPTLLEHRTSSIATFSSCRWTSEQGRARPTGQALICSWSPMRRYLPASCDQSALRE
jgi:hypothetical protein